jgi:UDP-N-acetyl-D-galactosamine dehydrogenase
MTNPDRKIAVVGLGYVGLPVALAFARRFPGTLGFDIDEGRVRDLARGHDSTGETAREELEAARLDVTSDRERLSEADYYVVAVPTPIDGIHRPDLRPIIGASHTIASVLKRGDIVVYESTVYPGVTEEVAGPILAEGSGLVCGVDFKLGYSPERINPGDKEHTLERVIKVVAGQDLETADIVAEVYGAIIEAGVHRAPSIKVAEAAKVIENTQRDLNVALMNEVALIFDRLGIRTKEVLDAAGTKWNFLRFTPGLVGGHCIGVDPYYLTTKAEELGYHPEVILAGRRINDNMGAFVGRKLAKLLSQSRVQVHGARIGILGLTFKPNVTDLRNSRVPSIIEELRSFGAVCVVTDPLASAEAAHEEYGLELRPIEDLCELDAVVLAVPHRRYLETPLEQLLAGVRPGGIVIDVMSVLDPAKVGARFRYWSL